MPSLIHRIWCDCHIYVSLIAASADRVPEARILIHLQCIESLGLINDFTRHCVA
jgi:hypothetical protein